MSGPKTCQYSIQAQRLQEQERALRQAADKKRREELAARVASARTACARLEKRVNRLNAAVDLISESFPTEILQIAPLRFKVPDSDNPHTVEDYAAKLEGELGVAERVLKEASLQAQANQAFRGATQNATKLCSGQAISAAEAMHIFSLTVNSKDALRLKEKQATIDRILGRYSGEGWEECPAHLERLVREALGTQSNARYEALTTELRNQVQTEGQEHLRLKAEAGKAKALLEQLELEIPEGGDDLKQQLELVLVGALALSTELTTSVNNAIAQERQARDLAAQEAAAGIVKEALLDLGYEVAPIEDTLFVKGGKVYFRKPGWSDYCVRLAVRPDESKLNFNVVRIADVEVAEVLANRSADIEAENAWCSGYQQLVDTFQARGLPTVLTRHLAVGALPIPVVRRQELPSDAFDQTTKKKKTMQKIKMRGSDTHD